LVKAARKKGLKGDRAKAFVFGTLRKIEDLKKPSISDILGVKKKTRR